MNYATNIALVNRTSGMVINVIWGMIYQKKEFQTETTQAVVIENLPVQIGDTYDGTDFYRAGEKIALVEDSLTELDEAYKEGVDSI